MSKVKKYKGWLICKSSDRERQNDFALSKFYCYLPGENNLNNDYEWESDNMEGIIEFIDCY